MHPRRITLVANFILAGLIAAGLLAAPAARAQLDYRESATTLEFTNQTQVLRPPTGTSGIFLRYLASGHAPILTVTTDKSAILDITGNDARGIFVVGVGGQNGPNKAGFAGSAIFVTQGGTLTTNGTAAHGIYGRSLGGVGGQAANPNNSNDFGLGRGGDVTLTNTGSLITFGANSAGLFAETLGGQGTQTNNGSAGIGGETGSTTVTNTGLIRTTGIFATALYARAWAGDAGQGSGAGANGVQGGDAIGNHNGVGNTWIGAVKLTNEGQVQTSASDSHGIFADVKGGNGSDGRASVDLDAKGGNGGDGGFGGRVIAGNTGTIMTKANNSVGILARTLGGNGGNGGEAKGFVAAAGSGGVGAFGGDITINAGGTITTEGSGAHGVLGIAQGGNAGYGAYGGGLVGKAGTGGRGGTGGYVTVNATGAITTTGPNSKAILAQSFGGLGGNGGGAAGVHSESGGGGQGGKGGALYVTVESTAVLKTTGADSAGVQAQNIGGGGGSGESAFAGLGALAGGGSAGGNGDLVRVTTRGQIETAGELSFGVFGQSIGGGGGQGGFSGGLFAFSGSGSSPSGGGSVDLTNSGKVTTTGRGANGIFGQSIGGGGGSANVASGLVAIGGNANSTGGRGDSYRVAIAHSGAVTTAGEAAVGVFAQSIGGSGGNAGGAGGWFTIGGRGSAGGNGGIVILDSTGAITTAGASSHGLVGQSIGGGGGSGGWARSYGIVGTAAVGGNSSGGGHGGEVTIKQSNTIKTTGDFSFGILGQSVGGGGGIAGDAFATGLNFVTVAVGGQGGGGGRGGVVSIESRGTIDTEGSGSIGVFAQSVGGGGGQGGSGIGEGASVVFASSVVLGGAGGSGNHGGAVTEFNVGAVTTRGDNAHGIFAQSVGGGGGKGGSSSAKATAVSPKPTLPSISIAVAVGGSGGAGGNGAAVNLLNNFGSTITTFGAGANGLYAQSIGGGGGDAGDASAMATALSAKNQAQISVGVGGKGGAAGNGGAVVVVNDNVARVVTAGDFANAVVAQSIGGGGGNGGFGSAVSADATKSGLKPDKKAAAGPGLSIGISVGVGGAGGAAGTGGYVEVNNRGELQTAGTGARGIFAQSVGGGGGTAGGGGGTSDYPNGNLSVDVKVGGQGGASGDGGAINVTNGGSIATTGSDADAIFAQSVGGGGGLGGSVVSSATSTGSEVTKLSFSAAVSVGGQGGGAGVGGAVKVFNTGKITTAGDSARGIAAQSVGGGGGQGGGAESTSEGGSASFNVSVGGAGGSGNRAGGAVTVTNTGSIATLGADAYAVFAQSVGAGGGAGGGARSKAKSGGKKEDKTGAISLGIGGAGNTAGDGGAVTVTSGGALSTAGFAAYGIMAQSVGGGGGLAGGGGSNSNSKGVSIGVAIGGQGGAAGNGGTVSLTNQTSGQIATLGDYAHAIFAQSIGGGGGGGGFGSAVAAGGGEDGKDTGDLSVGVAVGVGGAGGAAGFGGQTDVTNQGALQTSGLGSRGIFAQSIGGGGGAAGGSGGGADYPGSKLSIDVKIGGQGGASGNGGAVNVTNSGRIATTGHDADAIFVQSIGGGGGLGGTVDASAKTASGGSDKPSFAIAVGVGGKGGGAGSGGTVKIVNSGAIATAGNSARGIAAQSIGGGGGQGGGAQSTGSNGTYSFGVAIGGEGGSGSRHGGLVDITNSGSIATLGDDAHAIFAQSIGGGGGAGGGGRGKAAAGEGKQAGALALGVGGAGGSAGNGGAVKVNSTGSISTAGFAAYGILAQSVGGGGGIAGGGGAQSSQGINVGVAVGGAGGSGGAGGTVTLENKGTVQTTGESAIGIFGQSVGGGGGIGGAGSGDGTGIKSVGVSVGGNSNASGDGGKVVIAQSGDVQTAGSDAYGVFGQSIGGGGGLGGTGLGSNGGSIAVGGSGGAAGDGGVVNLKLVGNITTSGDGAHGLFAQSIGGGGGVGGAVSSKVYPPGGGSAIVGSSAISVGFGVTGSGNSAGHGGALTVASEGLIQTTGVAAHGILAQTIGGGGGLAGKNYGSVLALQIGGGNGAAGRGGDITITHHGLILATGAHSSAIFAQSLGKDGAGNITVALDGAAEGGSGQGAGIYLDGGTNNRITTTDVSRISARSGLAIKGTDGNDVIVNAGQIIGNIDLGAGLNRLDNLAGAYLWPLLSIDLQRRNTLTNAGTLGLGAGNDYSRAGSARFSTVTLNGNYTQTSTGALLLNADFAKSQGDRLNVTGAASLEGNIRVSSLSYVKNRPIVFLYAAGGLTSLATVLDTPFVDYELRADAKGLEVYIKDLLLETPVGPLNEISQQLEDSFDADSSAAGDIVSYLVTRPDEASLETALDRLSANSHLPALANQLWTATGFADNLLSVQPATGPFAPIAEVDGFWSKVSRTERHADATGSAAAHSSTIVRTQFGGQRTLPSGRLFGASLGIVATDSLVEDRLWSDGLGVEAGVAYKIVAGPWLQAFALNAGFGESDNLRLIGIPTPDTQATSTSRMWSGNFRMRQAYLFEHRSGLYLKPLADLDLTWLHQPGFSEDGAGAMNLHVESANWRGVTFSPAVQVGGTFKLGRKTCLRPAITVGGNFVWGNDWAIRSRFEGAVAGAAPMTASNSSRASTANVGLGVEFFAGESVSLRAQYDERFGEHATDRSASWKFAYRF